MVENWKQVSKKTNPRSSGHMFTYLTLLSILLQATFSDCELCGAEMVSSDTPVEHLFKQGPGPDHYCTVYNNIKSRNLLWIHWTSNNKHTGQYFFLSSVPVSWASCPISQPKASSFGWRHCIHSNNRQQSLLPMKPSRWFPAQPYAFYWRGLQAEASSQSRLKSPTFCRKSSSTDFGST